MRARSNESRPGRWNVLGQQWPSSALLVLAAACIAGDADADIQRSVDSSGVIQLSGKGTRPKVSGGDVGAARGGGAGVVMPAPGAGKASARFDPIIREAAALYQIPEALIRAVILVESGFDPRAVSPANAHGLMQLIPGTAERMMVSDIHDPRQNILGGTRYLRVLANMFNGNLALTLAGYNAGEGAVMKYGGVPPYAETQHYVRKVSMYYDQFRSE